MNEVYRPDLRAHAVIGDNRRVRAIRHSQEYWQSSEKGGKGGLSTVHRYLAEVAQVYEIPSGQLDNLARTVEYLEPREQGPEYRLSEEKHHFDAATYGFAQTYLNVPVWRAGLRVTVKQDPDRVISSEDTSEAGVEVRLPAAEAIERHRRVLGAVNETTMRARGANAVAGEAAAPGSDYLADIFKTGDGGDEVRRTALRPIRGRFWIYRYDASARLRAEDEPERKTAGGSNSPDSTQRQSGEVPDPTSRLPFDIPPPDPTIRDGAFYMVAEITFEAAGAEHHRRTWRALVELETDSILYLRPLASNVNAKVFENDPITKTGDTSLTSASASATLDLHHDDVVLQNLGPIMGGNQALTGAFATVTQFEGPNIPVPTQPAGTDFDFTTRTDNFAGVSGYFHVDRIFRIIQDLGWSTVSTYMANTVFPVPVDIRCFNNINAHCVGDGLGGIGHVGYGLMDTTDTVNPLGRACDPRVHLHEVLGHGILYEHVDGPNFNFAHSAGDGLSGIYFDPTSNCKGVDGTPVGKPGDLRFTYVPWHPSLNRRFDRNVASGWAWGGSQDDGGYGSEEILATTHFNVYRSIGGDSTDLGRRQFASRMTMYLILRAIQNLTPATNPAYARDFATQLMTVDALNWTSEGIFGGAYHKVIRWAYELQGEYQSPLIVSGGPGDGTIASRGDPPDVDVYIDDGRAGEYPYQPVHWHTTTIWNRRNPDGLAGHEEPLLGATNYVYVKIKNRGTQQATGVEVRGYHTKPGAGLSWPADFDPLTTAQISVGTLNANNSEEKTVGPFHWAPNINAYGHDCLLMVVAAAGDVANTDNFTAGESIPEWRLVPNDNNIGQRNVNPVAGGGGGEGLSASLDGIGFWVGNPNPKRATMKLDVAVAEVLRERGWSVELDGIGDQGFELAPGEKREVFIRVRPGRDFTAADISGVRDRDVQIAVRADDNVIGGMTYRLDPELRRPVNPRGEPGSGDGRQDGGGPGGLPWWIWLLILLIILLILLWLLRT